MAVLKGIRGPLAGQTFELKPDGTVLGRNFDADIVLPHDAVSRPHARIRRDDRGQWAIEDLDSLNGTSVNGACLRKGDSRIRVLWHRDRIKLCGFHFIFECDDAAEPAASVKVTDEDGQPAMTSLQLPSSSSEINLDENPQTKLKAFMGLIDSLANSIGVAELIPKVLNSLVTVFPRAQRGFIQLRVPESDTLQTAATFPPQLNEPICISRTIVDQVVHSRQAMVCRDAASDDRFVDSQSVAELNLRSLMCAPLLDSHGDVLGVMELDMLDNSGSRYFTADDLKVLASVARHVAIIVENARLHERAIEEQRLKAELDRIEHDLSVARKLQRGLLPSAAPRQPGYGFYSVYQPAEKVGGDYYDYIRLSGDRLAVVVADVSGEGIPAALLMARFAGDTRHFLTEESDPRDALARLNHSLIESNLDGRYITMVVAIIDPCDDRVTFINAGHWAPLLRSRDGTTVSVVGDDVNFALGWLKDTHFESFTVWLEPGDRICMFTDGVLDARNRDNEPYSLARLNGTVAAATGSVADVGQKVLADVRSFVGDAPQADDICLVCFGLH